MASKERRSSPRKECVVQLRFRIARSAVEVDRKSAEITPDAAVPNPAYLGTLRGIAVNLSERGIYFRSLERLNIGEPLEMYFSIPQELTGRYIEHVRCAARVVHVELVADPQGMIGAGAAVERFEPVAAAHDWGN